MAVMNLRGELCEMTHGAPRAVHSFTHLGDRIVPAPVFHALVFWLPAFLFSTTVHEAAHAWAALRLGDPTAYLAGQVSLSPWPHVRRSPIGMLVVPVITSLTQGWTMGWASAPYDAAWADRHPRRAALMALAGPLGNLLLAAVAFALLRAGPLRAGHRRRVAALPGLCEADPLHARGSALSGQVSASSRPLAPSLPPSHDVGVRSGWLAEMPRSLRTHPSNLNWLRPA